ncbi:MAG: 50S ribosomal protein L15 [Elusimicrobia bacterium]|nr:50S ribosomal protein L15 [Elusimicrobiota bacterium]
MGFGRGSGHGETSTRGQKGQRARSGNSRMEGYAGGQMSLLRRLPKRGFSNASFAKKPQCVAIEKLGMIFKAGAEVTPEAMFEKGLVRCPHFVKVLGGGKLGHSLKISAHGFSKGAKEIIEKAGGAATLIKEEKKEG